MKITWKRLILIWDNASFHLSMTIRKYINTQKDWLTIIHLPKKALYLNPISVLSINYKSPPSSSNFSPMVGKTDRANHQYDISDFWNAADVGNLPAVSS